LAIIFALSFLGLFYISLYSFVFAIIVGYLVLTVYKAKDNITGVVPVALAALFVFLLTGYAETVVFSTAFMLPPLLLCIALKKGYGRIVTASFGAAGYVVFFLLLFVYVVVNVSGGFGASEIKETGDFILKYIEKAVDAVLNNPELPISGEISKGEIMQLITEWTKAVIYTAVGFIVSVSFAASYLVTTFYRGHIKKKGLLEDTFADGWLPSPSLESAIFFAAVIILQFVFSGIKGQDVLFIAFSNLMMIFEIVFAIYGFTVTLEFFKKRRFEKMTLFSRIILIAFCFVFLDSAVTRLYAVGVITVIKRSFKHKEK